MPPRAELLDHHSYDASDALAKASIAPSSTKRSSTDVPTLAKAKASLRQRERRRRPRLVFRSTHGITGSVATLCVCIAIGAHHVNIIPNVLSILAAIASVVTASSGMSIVDQAPKQTIVMERPFKVVPPHRDAFKRTASSIYYLSARTCWNTISDLATSNNNNDALNWIWGISALCYAIIKFIPNPRDVDLTNGNTWVFVIPMAAGLTVDALFQLPLLQCNDGLCWNEDVITQIDLLWVLLSGLVVAFVFTLAFRGVLEIRRSYWGAALVVHAIVAYLIAKALPFLRKLVL
mmetsp:Transcript_2020/g.3697  ORF Transcript_2020/g.3697 Transcript_2020/m.3697 type:complete len:291 (+) Transcript_2020:85-957(+)